MRPCGCSAGGTYRPDAAHATAGCYGCIAREAMNVSPRPAAAPGAGAAAACRACRFVDPTAPTGRRPHPGPRLHRPAPAVVTEDRGGWGDASAGPDGRMGPGGRVGRTPRPDGGGRLRLGRPPARDGAGRLRGEAGRGGTARYACPASGPGRPRLPTAAPPGREPPTGTPARTARGMTGNHRPGKRVPARATCRHGVPGAHRDHSAPGITAPPGPQRTRRTRLT